MFGAVDVLEAALAPLAPAPPRTGGAGALELLAPSVQAASRLVPSHTSKRTAESVAPLPVTTETTRSFIARPIEQELATPGQRNEKQSGHVSAAKDVCRALGAFSRSLGMSQPVWRHELERPCAEM
jgi:hypothetical protein